MCRLLAYAAPAETTVATVIGPMLADSFQHMTRVHSDGWGTAWLTEADDGRDAEVETMRVSTPGQRDPVLASVLREQDTKARIVHLRLATNSFRRAKCNTHPFVHRGVAFVHNGSIVPVELFDDLLADEFRADVDGETDSELYFAFIRQEAARLESLEAGAVAAVRKLREVFPTSSLNAFLLTTDELLIVHAASTAHVTEDTFRSYGIDPADLPIDHDDEYYNLRMLRQPNGTTVFASSGLDTAGWSHVPDDTVTRVDLASLDLTQRRIFGLTSAAR